MTETMHLARNGWQPEEIEMLWQEIRSAAESGAPLRGVFERMGQTLGRKPNSVRNYYYMQLRAQAGEEMRRAAPFELFTEEEVHHLLREILMARGRGKSVRACVMALAGDDRALMLRYQNKYRSILRKHPEMIRAVCRELEEEGMPAPDIRAAVWEKPEENSRGARRESTDADMQAAYDALENLEKRLKPAGVSGEDRLRVQRDLLLLQVEDLQLAAKDVILCCKDFLGNAPEERNANLSSFCDELAACLAKLESCSG